MAVITTGSFAKALWPGINAWYGMQYDEHRVEYTDLFKTESSDKAYEEEVAVSGFGLAPKKAEAAGISYDTARQLFVKRYTNVTYGLGFIITREMYEDDLYSVIGKQRSRSLAFSMRQTKETVAGNIFNRAFNSSYTGGDGVALLSTSHPTRAGNQSNTLSTAADLSETSLESILIQISNLKDDRGLRIASIGTRLIIPSAYVFTAERLLESTGRVGTADNDINAIRAGGYLPDGYHVMRRISDSDRWFIKTDVPDGLKMFTRSPLKKGMEGDFETGNVRYKVRERYSFGWTDWRGVFGSEGAD